MTTMVYKFGLLPPVENAKAVREQMFQAHRYKNALVAIARPRREASRALEGALALDVAARKAAYDAADAEVEAAEAAVKAARKVRRSRSETAAMKERLAEVRAARKAAAAAWREARGAFKENPELIAERRRLCTEASKAGAEVYREEFKDVFSSGTRATVDDAIKQAEKEPLYAFGEPNDPRFRRWEGEGVIGLQVHQKGPREPGAKNGTPLPAAWFMSASSTAGRWLHVAPYKAERPAPRSPKVEAARARNAARRAEALASGGGRQVESLALAMRIGTGPAPGRAPVFARWPIVMHRPIPADAIIKRAVVQLRRIGPREEWSVALTVELAKSPYTPAPIGGGTVAVDIGWRAVPGGLRVARWIDQFGESDELILGDRPLAEGGGPISALRKCDDIRGTRDKNFNFALAELVAYLRETGMPEWMRALTVRRDAECPTTPQALAHLASWQAPRRLAALSRRWEAEGVEGHEAAAETLAKWRKQHMHLWQWESSQRKSAERRRQDTYRNLAARLASRYETLVVGDTNYAELAKRPVASSEPTNDAANSNRQRAAPGSLRAELERAMKSRGGAFKKLKAAHLSVTCPACGECDAAHDDGRMTVCTVCTYAADRDETMCLNLLRAAEHNEDVDTIIARRRHIGLVLGGQPTEECDHGKAAE